MELLDRIIYKDRITRIKNNNILYAYYYIAIIKTSMSNFLSFKTKTTINNKKKLAIVLV